MSAPPMGTSMAGDERRAPRFPMFSKMRITWGGPDVGTGPLAVWGLNMSDRGVAFVSDHPLPVGASIYLDLPDSRAGTFGTVRNCRRWGSAWRVGVEFEAGPAAVA